MEKNWRDDWVKNKAEQYENQREDRHETYNLGVD